MAVVPMSDGKRYTAVAIALHWLMAVGILALAAIGLLLRMIPRVRRDGVH